MGKYIVKRVLLLIPTIFIVCAIVFVLMRMVPGDAVDIIVNRMTQSGMTVDADAVRAPGVDPQLRAAAVNGQAGALLYCAHGGWLLS